MLINGAVPLLCSLIPLHFAFVESYSILSVAPLSSSLSSFVSRLRTLPL